MSHFSKITFELKHWALFSNSVFKHSLITALGMSWVSMSISCSNPKSNSNDTKSARFTKGNDSENAVIKENNAKINEGKGPSAFDPNKIFDTDTLIDAFYKIESATFGSQVCTGEGQLKVYSAIKKNQPLFSVPEGKLNCGPLGTVDLRPILASFAINPNDGTSEISNNFIRVKKVNNITYNPARPILPTFLSTKKEDLDKLNSVVKLEATDHNKNITVPGVIQFNMLSTGQEYRSRELRYTFRDVMHFKVVCSGFEGTDKGLSYCFDLAEWHLSLNPISILRMKYITPASVFIESLKNRPEISNSQIDALIKALPTAGGDGTLDGLIGDDVDKGLKAAKVEINMVLIDQKNLGTSEQKNDAKDADDQIVVGK